MNSRERVFALLAGEPVDHLPALPITMMFAADQIGAKYREYATNYRIQAEGQIRVAEKFGADLVSVISDPCCEASAVGAAIKWFPDQPPAMDEQNALLREKSVLTKLKVPNPSGSGRMTNRLEALRLLKEHAGKEKIVEGWVEGPCAESADLRGINRLMTDFYDDAAFVRDLMDFATELEIRFAKAQIEAGADIVGIGDAAASLLSASFYNTFVYPRQKRIADAIRAVGAIARLHICGDTRHILDAMGRVGADIVDLDSLSPLDEARRKMGPRQVLLGNIDPVRTLRNGTPDSVYSAVGECHSQAGARFIVGAGCEVVRDTPEENLHALVRYAHEHAPESFLKRAGAA
jgi:MtaA/CmuA family methyltransferase